MSSEIFEGESESGDFPQALSAAIHSAGKSLQTPYFVWRLDSVLGNSTGYVKVCLQVASTDMTENLVLFSDKSFDSILG